ncbi:MAG: prepilin-type N-terminal cleavage/methylation domain-containing protein [Actinomycetota bacterium]
MLLNNEDGYTLLELMVVILILGILFSLAVVTYTGVRNSGFDAEAKANLRHGVTAAQAYYTGNNAEFTGMDAIELEKLARGIGFRDGDINTDNDVYISDVTSTSYTLKCRSRSGIIFIATGEHIKVTYNF